MDYHLINIPKIGLLEDITEKSYEYICFCYVQFFYDNALELLFLCAVSLKRILKITLLLYSRYAQQAIHEKKT